jgi:hypothetical protein
VLYAAERVWSSAVTAGSHCSIDSAALAEVQGHPAIACWNIRENKLQYRRSLSTDGTSEKDWSSPVTLASDGKAYDCSLCVVDGNPAIAFHDNRNSDLHYVRSNTPTGSSPDDWGKAITIDSNGWVGYEGQLLVVDGHPAIVYSGNGSLKYVRSKTRSGSGVKDWNNIVVVGRAESDGGGCASSFAIVGGKPAISHLTGDYPTFTLQYTYSTTVTGSRASEWKSIDIAKGDYYETFLADVNAKPGIILREAFSSPGDKYNNRLLYFHPFASKVGILSDWRKVEVVSDEGLPFGIKSENGLPVIIYQHSVKKSRLLFSYWQSTLELVTALDPEGLHWGGPETVHRDGEGYTGSAMFNGGKAALAFYEFSDSGDVRFVGAQ